MASVLAVAALTSPPRISAQPRVRRVGYLSGATQTNRRFHDAFEQGLRDLGWYPGQSILIEFKSADGRFERLPALAADFVQSGVDLIFAPAAPETNAARAATNRIPIVFAVHGDPVGTGAVQTLARPGGNVTGLSQAHPDIVQKQLELLKLTVPRTSRVAVIWNAANPAKASEWKELVPAAQALGLTVDSREVRGPDDFEGALAGLQSQRPDALLALGDPLMFQFRAPLAAATMKLALPTMYPFREFVEAGGLMAYGAHLPDLFRRAASYVDKILKGARPADLPVQQPTKFEFVINMKTAKAWGLTIPPSVLLRADHVFE